MRRGAALVAALAALTLGLAACSKGPDPIRVGAVYPLSGSLGPGGVDEYRGVQLAVQMANDQGGVNGRPIELVPLNVPAADVAPGAVDALAKEGVRLVLGSYGSTISEPAGIEAYRDGLLFWETGAVGSMPGPGPGQLFFRVAPSGSVLGRAAVAFIAERLAPLLHRRATSLRFAVVGVDDVYGNSVAGGAVAEIHGRGLPFAGWFRYDPYHFDMPAVVRRIAAARPDVLFVSAYLQDGVALRRELVRQRVPLLANIGTSSSYCMPAFGQALGRAAVGVFASDKPDADALNLSGLLPSARALLAQARSAYRARYHQEMSAPALAGFSAAWALFRTVMPHAPALSPNAVAAAALQARIPEGGLPNGSGLELGQPGTPDAGANLRAASVIWEWVGVDQRAVVWPPQFATQALRVIPFES
jgi:branched-chain amino acid transport system substrate-binding protein